MEYRVLGKTGVMVSRLCFGTMSFGAEADAEMAGSMFAACRDAGINFFDCADTYSNGTAEEILGGLIAGCRDELVLTSKVYNPMGSDPNARGLSRRHIINGVEASLRRLKTDYLDLYFAHKFDDRTDMEQTLRAFDDLVRDGKIRYPAVSNWAAWQIATALGISRASGLARFECVQPMYNLVKRQAETEILPLAQAEQLAVIPYNPLGAGLLTGKYGIDNKPEAGRLVERAMYARRYSLPAYFETAERFTAYARQRQIEPATLAVAWVMSHPAVTAPIIGARNTDQLKATLAAAELELTPEWREEITALSVTPANALDRLEDQLADA